MSREDLAERLAGLAKHFLQQLPGKMERIEAALGPAPDLVLAQRLIHGLAGSGGTFGFPAISSAAAKLGQALPDASDEAGPVGLHAQSELEVLKAAVTDALAAGIRPAFASVLATTGTTSARPARSKPPRAIFIVEDDLNLARSIQLQLGHFGYTCTVFESPDAMLQHAGETSPAALIMDLGFPQGEFAGARTLSTTAAEGLNQLPMVFISARDDLDARLAAVRAGGKAYFTKPVDVSALAARLDQLTERTTPPPIKVLIIEDDEDLAQLYVATLSEEGMEATYLCNPRELDRALVESRPDIILMDLYLPDCSGIELAAVIRQQVTYVGVPIVFLSSEWRIEKQLLALKNGADDFLTKPISPERLVSIIGSRARRAGALREHIDHDSLTGLLNHGKLEAQLELELLRVARTGKPLAFAMIDLDHFKAINDSYGHAAGDHVLRALSYFLRSRLRRTDIAGRYGGEEFALILTDTDAANAHRMLDTMRHDFASLIHVSGKVSFNVTFSCGVADSPGHACASTLAEAADAALYEAKRLGRNRVHTARPPQAAGTTH